MTTIAELLNQWQESIEAVRTQSQSQGDADSLDDHLTHVEGMSIRSRILAGEAGENVAGVNRCVWGTIDLS